VVRRLALILLTCLSLLWPHAAAVAACDLPVATDACCGEGCSCCDRDDACCCSGEEAPLAPADRAPAPNGSRGDLERSLCLPLPAPAWSTPLTACTLEPSAAPRARAPHASGRALLRQGCRLRH
jgi:hypothetical protein